MGEGSLVHPDRDQPVHATLVEVLGGHARDGPSAPQPSQLALDHAAVGAQIQTT